APQADETFWQAQQESVRKAARGASAPLMALESVRHSTILPFDEAMAFERQTFLERRDSREAAALRRIFFAERGATRPATLQDV
ncbi:3-hydroxyacyl-CoA dehydrogenase, partial [Ochrobactrum sp. SFR4]|nr:3-hydroxyacyl-CoA dehydrogenase [Ochrobactrum sp. SFR4]